MTIPFEKKVVFGTMGMIVIVAFWISPELGLLALGGIILLSIIYSLIGCLRVEKREQVAFEAEHSCPLVKERRSGSIFLSIAVVVVR